MRQTDPKTYGRMIQAALKLFASKGYDGTTTREIVKEAGSSLSTLQFYFQSKESLYQAALIQALEHQHELLKPVLDEIDSAEQQNMLNQNTAWNLIVDLISKMSDWVFLQEDNDAILLMNREILAPSTMFSSVPGHAMDIHRYFQKLFESYCGVQNVLWSKLLSFSIVMSLFGLANNASSILGQVLNCDVSAPDNIIQIKTLAKSHLLSSIRACLDSHLLSADHADDH